MASAATGSSPAVGSDPGQARPLEGALGIVTGPLGKLGPSLVTALAGAGADVVGVDVGDRGADELAGAVADLGATFRLERADVADKASLLAGGGRGSELGPPAGLCNRARIEPPPPPPPRRPPHAGP